MVNHPKSTNDESDTPQGGEHDESPTSAQGCQNLIESPSSGSISLPLEALQLTKGGEVKPRQLAIRRSSEHGYGFTLRHFIVYPPGPTDSSSSVEECLFKDAQDPLDTIFVRQVRDGSPAHLAGLSTGDQVLTVNNLNVRNHTYQDIISIIQKSQLVLHLIVIASEHDVLQQIFNSIAHKPESNLDVDVWQPNQSPIALQGTLSSSLLPSQVIINSTYPLYEYDFPPFICPLAAASIVIPCLPDGDFSSLPVLSCICTSSMPVLPAHRVIQSHVPPQPPHSSNRAASYHHAHLYSLPYPSSTGSKLSLSSQHKRKTTGSLKDLQSQQSANKKTPIIIDRKQAVYNIKRSLPSGLQDVNLVESRRHHSHSSKRHSLDYHVARDRKSTDVAKRQGIYEPVIVRGEIKGNVGEAKRLERDPDGRLYEVVQTRLVESRLGHCDFPEINRDRLSLPCVSLSNLERNPENDAKLSDSSVSSSNKENSRMTSNSYKLEKSTQEAIERIKRNVEKKEEFLMRPNEPMWLPSGKKEPNVHKDYHVNPQRMPPPIWPPTSPGSNSTSCPHGSTYTQRSTSSVSGPKGSSHILRRTKSEHDDTSSYPSSIHNHYQSPYMSTRSGSLPGSPVVTEANFMADVASANSSSNVRLLNPLAGNIVAKPYVGHQLHDDNQPSKYSKSFVSTLSRIQENIPASDQDLQNSFKALSTSSLTGVTSTTPSSGWKHGQAPYNSQPSLMSPSRTVPLAWVGDNERIKQLQIVSTRAKKFEDSLKDKDSYKASLRGDRTRLSGRTKAVNVAQRREEFEKRLPSPHEPGYELGTSFNISNSRHGQKDGSSAWSPRTHGNFPPGGVMRSFSDGGSVFPVSKEFLSLPTDQPYEYQSYEEGKYKGNRTVPVGGSKIHCDPPDSYTQSSLNDSEVLERDRSHSTCSQSLWPEEDDPRKASPLVRQHSFHSTLRTHFAKAVGSLHRSSGGSFEVSPAGDVSPSKGGSLAASRTPSKIIPRRKLLPDENERLVRRVSYLKATSGDRICTDSEGGSDDETQADPRGVARRALAGQVTSDLPSPASLSAFVTSQGSLNVKYAKYLGKKSHDRSWKSVHAVVKGRALLFYKDKIHESQSPLHPDDQVSLKGADVGVATEYTKRKNVIRLSTPVGSQFLLQAESDAAMTAWLTSLSSASSSQEVDVTHKDSSMQDSNLNSGLDANPSIVTPVTPNSINASSTLSPVTSSSSEAPELTPQSIDVASSTKTSAKKVTSPLRPRASIGMAPSSKMRQKSVAGENNYFAKSKTWKERIGKHLPRKPVGSHGLTSPMSPLPEGASIGVNLKDCPPAPENENIPLLVSLCVKVVEMKGLSCQGIYRIPGNIASVSYLSEIVNKGPDAIDLSDIRWSDLNVISSLLKQFFQKLPDSLVTSELYPKFIEASRTEDQQRRLIRIKALIQELPRHNYETLQYLMQHLNNVVANSDHNKMSVANLATVFGPTLVRSADDNVTKMVTDMSHQCRIVMIFISQFHWLFNEDSSELPTLEETITPTTEIEPSSLDQLLDSVKKIESSHKEKNKLLNSIIVAADRLQRTRHNRKTEEDPPADVSSTQLDINSDKYRSTELPDPIPMNQRRISNMSLSSITAPTSTLSSLTTELDKLPGGVRDGRLFVSDNDSVLQFDALSSLSSLNTSSMTHSMSSSSTAICTTVNSLGTVTTSSYDTTAFTPTTNSSLSKSEPSHLGDDRAIRTYAELSESTQERIRKFKQETAAMLQRDFKRHQREQKWEMDRRKIEEEWQKAKKDLETEDIFDQLADNPSQVVPKMTNYSWSSGPTREAVSLASMLTSKGSVKNANKAELSYANPPLPAPYAVSTNPSAKNDRYHGQELADGATIPQNEGSDLLSAITATFEEKMRNLQESSILSDATLGDSSSGSTSISGSGENTPREPSASGQRSKHGGAGPNCRLYRDPSLHRRRNSPSAPLTSSSLTSVPSLAQAPLSDDQELFNGGLDYANIGRKSDSLSKAEKTDHNNKEKTEKRTRDPKRGDGHDHLREKKPKELRRSITEDAIYSLPRDDTLYKGDLYRSSSELKSRRHNVKELKEKFEQTTSKTLREPSNSTLSGCEPTTEKLSRSAAKQARKSRIKRRHTVGGMKDMARVAWLKVVEAAYINNLQKNNLGYPESQAQLPSWEQLQLFIEALSEGKKLSTGESIQSFVAKEKLGGATTSPDIETILSMMLQTQKKATIKRHVSVREANRKSLHPLLESNV